MVKYPSASAGDAGQEGSIPGLGRSPGGGNSNPLQYSCLGNPMDRGVWWAIYMPLGHKESDMTEQLSMHACPIFPTVCAISGCEIRVLFQM